MGVAFTTLSTLILELSLTRIFSVVFFYHFAFLAISIALFGFGAGGVFSYVVAGWRGNIYFKAGNPRRDQQLRGARVPDVHALSIVMDKRALVAVFFASALPFFFSGDRGLVGGRGSHRASGPRLFLRSARSRRWVPAAGPFAEPIRRSEHGAVDVRSLRGVGGHLVQPGRNVRGTRRRRGRRSGVRRADHLQLETASHRYPLCQGHALRKEQFVQWNSFSRIGLAINPGDGLPS